MAEQDIAIIFKSPTLNVAGIGWVVMFARAVTCQISNITTVAVCNGYYL